MYGFNNMRRLLYNWKKMYVLYVGAMSSCFRIIWWCGLSVQTCRLIIFTDQYDTHVSVIGNSLNTQTSTLSVHDTMIYQWTLEVWYIHVLKIDCIMLISIACHSWHCYMLMILTSSKLLRKKWSWRTNVCLMLIKQLFAYDYLGPVIYIQYYWGMDWLGVEFWRRVILRGYF